MPELFDARLHPGGTANDGKGTSRPHGSFPWMASGRSAAGSRGGGTHPHGERPGSRATASFGGWRALDNQHATVIRESLHLIPEALPTPDEVYTL